MQYQHYMNSTLCTDSWCVSVHAISTLYEQYAMHRQLVGISACNINIITLWLLVLHIHRFTATITFIVRFAYREHRVHIPPVSNPDNGHQCRSDDTQKRNCLEVSATSVNDRTLCYVGTRHIHRNITSSDKTDEDTIPTTLDK